MPSRSRSGHNGRYRSLNVPGSDSSKLRHVMRAPLFLGNKTTLPGRIPPRRGRAGPTRWWFDDVFGLHVQGLAQGAYRRWRRIIVQ